MIRAALAAIAAATILFIWSLSKEIEAFCEMEETNEHCK